MIFFNVYLKAHPFLFLLFRMSQRLKEKYYLLHLKMVRAPIGHKLVHCCHPDESGITLDI